MNIRRRLEPRRRLMPTGANPDATRGMPFDPWMISVDLALRRYLVGAYIYEHIPGGEWLSDLEWDQLYLRIKRDWHLIKNPHKKLLDPNNLRSAAHIPEHEFPLIIVHSAAKACDQSITVSRMRVKLANKPIEKRYPRIYSEPESKQLTLL